MDLGIYATIVLQMAASYKTWVIPRPGFFFSGMKKTCHYLWSLISLAYHFDHPRYNRCHLLIERLLNEWM
jgi:hypothetical protein